MSESVNDFVELKKIKLEKDVFNNLTDVLNNSTDVLNKPTLNVSVESTSIESTSGTFKSRFGRSHKPKTLGDFISTDRRVSAVLKVQPGNQMKFYMKSGKLKSPKKESKSPKKSPKKATYKRPTLIQTTLPFESIKIEPRELEPAPGCEWMVGDLAWARVGNYPFWPCIINNDPTCGIFTRIRMFSRHMVPLRGLHVQFFGDHGRRSWLFTSSIMNYTGREAFENLAKSILSGIKKKDQRQIGALIVKPHLKNNWVAAVNEAEALLNATREERVWYFRKLYPVPMPNKPDNEIPKPATKPVEKRGRKRKAESLSTTPTVASKQIKLEKSIDNIISKSKLPSRTHSRRSSLTKNILDESESPNKLRILERVLSSQNSNESGVVRSPSVRLKRIKEENEEKKKILKQEKANKILKPSESNETVKKEAALYQIRSKEKTTAVNEPKRSKEKTTAVNEPKRNQLKETVNKKTNKKLNSDYHNFRNKNYDKVSDENPDKKGRYIEKRLEKMWSDMNERQKAKYRSKISVVNGSSEKTLNDETAQLASAACTDNEESEERRSNSSEKSSSPAPLAKGVSKSNNGKKSNSLFIGALNGKVCQICEKPGNTLKCKGPCSGIYHLECALNPVDNCAKSKELMNSYKARVAARKNKVKKLSNLEDSLDESKNESVNETDKITKLEKDQEDSIATKNESSNNRKSELDISNKGKKSKESKGTVENVEENEFRCPECTEGKIQPCFYCGLEEKNGDKERIRCHIAYCGKVYHAECLKAWPQTSWTTGRKRGSTVRADIMTCPQHSCHTCISDNPRSMKARFQNDRLVRCIRCPTSYHYGNHCLPAGSEVISNKQIICPKHCLPHKKVTHLNAAWCFICAVGGSLICCDLCPTSFHADCLKISPPEGGYICEDCETGRFPLYGEVIWVKLGSYRWWPAQILFPSLIPENINKLPHSRGEFAVKFFGSHDHYWVNRGRVFLFQEGDSGKGTWKHSTTDQVFLKAVKEASEVYLKVKTERSLREAESRPGMKPPNYIKIKTNKPVGTVRSQEANISSMTPCECDPDSPNPCAPDSDCLNRILMVECNPLICPAGERCMNQMFEKRQYPPLIPYRTEGRGWGLKTLTDLKKGQFVIEYVGEMIDEQEYQRRLKKMHQSNDENYYFLTIDKDRMLDAGPKGNVSRFMNHSCQPNCETQKWTVNGDTRVGLFTLEDITANTELVFNYNLASTGNDKKPCMCGAPNCSGFIGVKAKQNLDDEKKHSKKVNTRRKSSKNLQLISDELCFMCGEGGELLLCDKKDCPKGYHLPCINRSKWPQGKWVCSWHHCNICNKGKVQRCALCLNSFCPSHADGNIKKDKTLGYICYIHEPKDGPKTEKVKSKIQKIEDKHLSKKDTLMKVDDPLNRDIPNEFNDKCVPLSCSSPIPPKFSEINDAYSEKNNDGLEEVSIEKTFFNDKRDDVKSDKVVDDVESVNVVDGVKSVNEVDDVESISGVDDVSANMVDDANKSVEEFNEDSIDSIAVVNENVKTINSIDDDELTDLVVMKPIREYRNRRFRRSKSPLFNSVTETHGISHRSYGRSLNDSGSVNSENFENDVSDSNEWLSFDEKIDENENDASVEADLVGNNKDCLSNENIITNGLENIKHKVNERLENKEGYSAATNDLVNKNVNNSGNLNEKCEIEKKVNEQNSDNDHNFELDNKYLFSNDLKVKTINKKKINLAKNKAEKINGYSDQIMIPKIIDEDATQSGEVSLNNYAEGIEANLQLSDEADNSSNCKPRENTAVKQKLIKLREKLIDNDNLNKDKNLIVNGVNSDLH